MGSQLERHRRDWEELAAVDPLWAILTSPEHRRGRWQLDAFFASGEADVAEVLAVADRLGYPKKRRAALDFGCGVGRLTRALSTRFDKCVGVDISARMIDLACELNADITNCRFLVNVDDLAAFQTRSIDFVYSTLVLQHQPSEQVVERYIAEFMRVVTADGLVVFQMLADVAWTSRLQPRRRLYAALRALRVPERLLLGRARLTPARGIAVRSERIREIVEQNGGELLHIERLASSEPVESNRYYARTASSARS